jgi:hypothetical protein
MSKSPFERVFSMIDRKKLLQRVGKEMVNIVVKNEQDQVFIFKAMETDVEYNLLGFINSPVAKDFQRVTALFYVDKERYFLTTRLRRIADKQFILLNDTQFFKFNRRNAFRIVLEGKADMTLQVASIRNIDVNKEVEVLEFSSGGARIRWTGQSRLAPGTIIKGILQWKQNKIIPVDASIVHNLGKGVYGVRFVNLSPILANRLKMLSVEVQQTIFLA